MKNLEDYKTMKSGFTTPDGYFDTLKGRLLTVPEREAMPKESVQAQAPHGFWGIVRPQLNLAASFLVMIALGFGLVYLVHPAQKPAIQVQAQQQVSEDQSAEVSMTAEAPLSNEGIIQYLSDTDIDYYYLANNQ